MASHGFVVAGVTPTYSANATVLIGHVVDRTPAGNPQDLTDAVAAGLVQLGAINGRRGLAISAACVLAFLDHVPRSGPAPDRLDAQFPELQAYG